MSKLQLARDAIEQSSGVCPLNAGEVRHLMERARSGMPVVVDDRILATLAMLLMAVDATEGGAFPETKPRGPLREVWATRENPPD